MSDCDEYPKLLDFPSVKGASKEYLNGITANLIRKYKHAVNCEQECLSICNQALNRAIARYNPSKGSQFGPFYYLIATRLLLNAVRHRNGANRIPLTDSIHADGIEKHTLNLTHSSPEPLNLDFLLPEEAKLIDLFFVQEYDAKELADMYRVSKVTIHKRLVKIVKTIKNHYGQDATNFRLDSCLKRLKTKTAYSPPVSFSLEEINSFSFLRTIEKDLLIWHYVEGKPLSGFSKAYKVSAPELHQKALVKIRLNADYHNPFFIEENARGNNVRTFKRDLVDENYVRN